MFTTITDLVFIKNTVINTTPAIPVSSYKVISVILHTKKGQDLVHLSCYSSTAQYYCRPKSSCLATRLSYLPLDSVTYLLFLLPPPPPFPSYCLHLPHVYIEALEPHLLDRVLILWCSDRQFLYVNVFYFPFFLKKNPHPLYLVVKDQSINQFHYCRSISSKADCRQIRMGQWIW